MKSFADNKKADIALASRGGLLDCYAEAMRLQAIEHHSAEQEQFNLVQGPKFSDIELADQVILYQSLFNKLGSQPNTFLRELTVGLFQLKDQMYLEEHAKDYGGNIEQLLKKDKDIHATEERSENLLLLPPGQRSIGKYYEQPDVSFDAFYGLATGVNNASLSELAGAKVKDLPLTLTFRFWAWDPFLRGLDRILGSPDLCKVWFERRVDKNKNLSFSVSTESETGLFDHAVSDGTEWLASYYMHSIGIPADHDLSDDERSKYAPLGAEKLYKLIENKPIGNVSNSDVF